jgi:hypothetical protein
MPLQELVALKQFVGAVWIGGVVRGQNPPETGEHTGLPCPNCGVRQKKIDMTREADNFFLRISGEFDSKGVRDLIKLMRKRI